MRFPRSTKVFRGQLEAAPFIGVFFLLIILLLLRSSFVFTPGVPIQLPEAANLPGSAGPVLVVSVDKEGQLYFQNQVTDEPSLKEEFEAAVSRTAGPLTLVIQADKAVKYETMIRLGLLARGAGIKEVRLATRPQPLPVIAPART
jgi:biopolymer transport protein ExbD